jgi:hypothetical protein
VLEAKFDCVKEGGVDSLWLGSDKWSADVMKGKKERAGLLLYLLGRGTRVSFQRCVQCMRVSTARPHMTMVILCC